MDSWFFSTCKRRHDYIDRSILIFEKRMRTYWTARGALLSTLCADLNGKKRQKKMHMAHIRLTHFSVQQRIARHGKETVCVCVCAHMCSVTQSCPPDCDPTDCSPPGYSVHGIFQARILEQVAISFASRFFLTQGSNTCLLHLLH